MTDPLSHYLSRLQATLATGDATEHSYRGALADLIAQIAAEVTVINEPKRIACGAPDLVVYRDRVPVGYIEAKDIGVSLDAIEDEGQIARYREALGNFILTDYVEFRWYRDATYVDSARIGIVDSAGTLRRERGGAQAVARLLERFLATQAATVRTARELAQRMAGLARLLRTSVLNVFETQSGTPLHQEFESFRSVLLHDLTPDQFADMYAQTVCYGLFSARCSTPPGNGFSRQAAPYLLPRTNPFLQQMFVNMAGPGAADEIEWIIVALCDLLQHARMAAILQDFGQRTRREDPVVHFYETFLQAYDSSLREMRGVYYTPEPVVSYIVRSVDHLLRERFGCSHGLADASTLPATEHPGEPHRVHILDPACGTGTFLHAVINTIFGELEQRGQAGAWSSYVPRHLLPRLHGFELLMAPYAVAHLKLGLQLQELGYDFASDDRLQVYLTNSLEQAQDAGQSVMFAPAIAHEVNAANTVKETIPVMVVLGNPPYSGHSANKSPWLDQLLHGLDTRNGSAVESYFQVDGADLGERNPKWLNDDYVKFIRLAQWRIQRTGYGVLAFITNHGYLDNPTFRGMRQSLMADFDSIYLLDLHGNAKKRETCPDGSPDENVFDIQQGVAIGLFVKDGHRPDGRCQVHHADLYGLREQKYAWLSTHDVARTDWQDVSPVRPLYLYLPRDRDRQTEFASYRSVRDVFPLHSLGLLTKRDRLAIGFTASDAQKNASLFLDEGREDSDVARLFGIPRTDNDGWDLGAARHKLREKRFTSSVQEVTYRPFDKRAVWYDDEIVARPNRRVLQHLCHENIALVVGRQGKAVGSHEWNLAFVVDSLVDQNIFRRGGGTVFPLWLLEERQTPAPDLTDSPSDRRANLDLSYLEEFRRAMSPVCSISAPPGGRLESPGIAMMLFRYVYALLYSRSYRSRFADQLDTSFPHVPIARSAQLLGQMAALGQALIDVHLMRAPALSRLITAYPINGDNRVTRVEYEAPTQERAGRVWINASQYVAGVSPDLWEYQIGGYQVLDKWLRDRRKRVLTYEEIIHYQRVVVALAETQRLQREIDGAIEAHGGWPLS